MALIIIVSIILYAVASVTIYHGLYHYEKKQKIVITLAGCILLLVVTIIACFISSSNLPVENKEYVAIARNTSILLLAPIYCLIILPVLAKTLNRYKAREIQDKQMRRRMLILLGLTIIIFILGISYARGFQLGLLNSVIK